MGVYTIAVIPGDGIGGEVISAGVNVLEALARKQTGLEMKFEWLDWGSERYLKTGRMMPEDGLAILKSKDAIYFGSAGDPRVPDHVSLWGLRLAICQGFDQYANIRPARLLPGLKSPLREAGPKEIDWLIIRENSEGEYSGAGGRVHRGLPLETGMDISLITRAGAERII
ncbi:MAG: tartrate dehydrogenase, partial [Hyphomicrobiaceae bacterium]